LTPAAYQTLRERSRIRMYKKYLTVTVILIAAFLIVALMAAGSQCAEKKAVITIKNETTHTLYIVIDDFNQGELWPNYSQEYKVTIGEHKVQAYYDDKVISKYIKVSETYPYNDWCIGQSDL